MTGIADGKLAGKTVLITGGTSGIGLAAAICARDAGANVIVLGSDPVRTGEVAKAHGLGGWIAANVAEPDAIENAMVNISHVDHLVLLAGQFIGGSIMTTPLESFQQIFNERFWSVIHILRTLGERLAEDASVTFVSGELADRPNAQGTAVLGAAITAVEYMARALALEMAPRRFNTVAPGPIDTPLFSKVFGASKQAYVDERTKNLPLKRFGQPEEVGEAVLFLMINGYMNGATLNVDGASRVA